MNNNIFNIKNDRFHLLEKECYILDGWMGETTELAAFLDNERLEMEIMQLPNTYSDKMHGLETKVMIQVPMEIRSFKNLSLYISQSNARKLCFRISTRELEDKRENIRCFIDELELNREDGICRIQGWCVSDSPVKIALADADKNKIDCEIQRFNRKDVVSLYEEYPVDPHCGFHVELNSIPDKKMYLLLKTEKYNVVEAISTSVFVNKKEAIQKQIKKGISYFQYNGIEKFLAKSFKKAFDAKFHAPIVYSKWILKHLPSDKDLEEQRRQTFSLEPKFSIVVPLYQTPLQYLEELIASVKAQTYTNWELCLSDGSGALSPLNKVLDQYEAVDSRIKAIRNEKQLHISENTNAAIEAASGDYLVFADHDDLLTPNALFECAKAINNNAKLEILYSDEDKISMGNKYMHPHLKPDFNIDLLCTVNYICHLFVVKRTLIDDVGMLRPEFDGAQDYDFILRCVESTRHICHIPKILYHWRFFEGSTAENPESKLYAFEAGKRAVAEHYKRIGVPVHIEKGEYLGLYKTKFLWPSQPLISIIIPNKDHIEDLQRCMSSLDEKSTYRNYEYIIVENNSTEEKTFEYYSFLEETKENVRVVKWKQEFNYSAINNYGAKFAKGDYYLLLNNDTEIINPDCVEELLGYCMREDVGAVGARLYYDDDTVQHAGVIIGFGGIAGHAFVQQKRGATGYCHRIICAQDYSAVTAACMMVKKTVYEAVGGFSEELKVAFNDVDFCMKIGKLGKLIVYNPYAELYHYESKSRGLEDTPEKVARFHSEIETFAKKWPKILQEGDPYYNRNLTLESQDFSLKRI